MRNHGSCRHWHQFTFPFQPTGAYRSAHLSGEAVVSDRFLLPTLQALATCFYRDHNSALPYLIDFHRSVHTHALVLFATKDDTEMCFVYPGIEQPSFRQHGSLTTTLHANLLRNNSHSRYRPINKQIGDPVGFEKRTNKINMQYIAKKGPDREKHYMHL